MWPVAGRAVNTLLVYPTALSFAYTPPRWTPLILSTTPVPPSVHTSLFPATTSTHDVLPPVVSVPLPLPTKPVYGGAVLSAPSGSSASHPLFEPPEPVTSVVPSNLSTFDFRITPTTSITNPQVKLPKLILRKFNGDLTKWVTFWDTFNSAIHSNPNISSVDKFSYVHSLMDSTAAEAIAGLTLTAANYEEAVSTLKQRFGNSQIIAKKHMISLMHLPSITSHHNLKGV